jgi:hypothetical protein
VFQAFSAPLHPSAEVNYQSVKDNLIKKKSQLSGKFRTCHFENTALFPNKRKLHR